MISSTLDVLSIVIHRWNALTLLLTVVTSQTLASLVQWHSAHVVVSAQTQAKSKFSLPSNPPLLCSSPVQLMAALIPLSWLGSLLPHTVSAPTLVWTATIFRPDCYHSSPNPAAAAAAAVCSLQAPGSLWPQCSFALIHVTEYFSLRTLL